jgi:uncharacterized protein YeaO (DUF488 family)
METVVMSKVIYTIQISNVRAAHLAEVPVLDVTVKSGDRTFAPDWDMVMQYKSGHLTESEYTTHYRRLMLISQTLNRTRWREVLNYTSIALACYCRPGNFCHRVLLKEMLLGILFAEGEDVVDGGELVQSDK